MKRVKVPFTIFDVQDGLSSKKKWTQPTGKINPHPELIERKCDFRIYSEELFLHGSLYIYQHHQKMTVNDILYKLDAFGCPILKYSRSSHAGVGYFLFVGYCATILVVASRPSRLHLLRVKKTSCILWYLYFLRCVLQPIALPFFRIWQPFCRARTQ